jgi:hypothetical protein
MKNIALQQVKNQIASTQGPTITFVKSKRARAKSGKVIGHTRSSKPIYRKKYAHDYKDFTKEDHMDAANLHLEYTSNKKDGEFESNLRSSHAETHRQAANVLYEDLKRLSNLILKG